MTLIVAGPDYARWDAVQHLVQQAFAYMERLLGYPARAAQLTAADLAAEARTSTVYLIVFHDRPVACLFCRASRDTLRALYIGKLAVAANHRGAGLARQLVSAAEDAARARGLTALTLDTGAAFPQLHTAFQKTWVRPTVNPGAKWVSFPV